MCDVYITVENNLYNFQQLNKDIAQIYGTDFKFRYWLSAFCVLKYE